MSRVSFLATAQESKIIRKIVMRVFDQWPDYPDDFQSLLMDIEAAHSNGCKLDLAKLLKAPKFDFFHDIYGIRKHLDRNDGKLKGCFVPRCAMKVVGHV